MSGIEDDPGLCVCADCQNAREPRFLGLCPYCYSPMNGPCGHCIAEANATGTPYEVKRLKDFVCDREDTIIERDASIARVRALAAQWEQVGPSYQSLPEGAAQLRQALDEIPLVCPESCAGQSWTGVDQADGPGKVWRCDTCGRIVSQHVSNPLQAADDRRAL